MEEYAKVPTRPERADSNPALPLSRKAEATLKKSVATFQETLAEVSQRFATGGGTVRQKHVDGAKRYLGFDEMNTKTPARPTEPHGFNEETMQDEVRNRIRQYLFEIDPHNFEHVIEQLLSAMGYQDTEVTPASNDKGVDVTGTITVAITAVREVVQVKRLRSNVQRPAVDMLRGSLYRSDAIRGTIINTGGFSPGAREAAQTPGAAPITLIDGSTLVDLLIKNDLGVKRQNLELWKFDASAFHVEKS